MPLHWTSDTDELDWEELSALYRAAPLGDKSPQGLRTAFTHSMFKFLVYEDGKLVGVGRALGDGVACSHICDVAVPGKETFYEKLGFARMNTAMAIFQNQAQAVERGYLQGKRVGESA